ncbi:leucine-rich repeat serine/threonine-protein kinase 2 [Acipenser oxyrinchus oxyrinchus]|uniref:non-specific serine/threonine protein kinase n=1 Tax=Acipenser oxyrinchus oxyrinchus TaxID=40147 RepID=A0AAD8G887_ACIOX|nr:leucine-rich repeat serine/threonine-protein kinase 2 [Acipenser oxyrinchus oxyrinchus]
MAILNSIKQFQDNEDTVLNALRAILPLTGPASNVEVLMSGNERCYSLIMNAMETFPNNEEIQEIGCCLFQKFTSESFYNILVLNGVHKVIIKASMTYLKNANLQASSLTCLACLTETIILNKDLYEWKEEEEDKCLVDACCRAMEFHRASKEVQEAACWALNNLLVYESKLNEMFGDEDGRYPVHRQVMAAMLLHSSSKGVFQAAANALATLADQNVKIRALLLSNGIHINIIELMKKHSDSPDVAESACRLLYKLFQGSLVSLDVVTMAMAEILSAMKIHNCVPSVQLEALRASLLFVSPGRNQKGQETAPCTVEDPDAVDVTPKVIKNQCVLEGAHTLVLESLNKFIGSPAIQEYGLRVLCSLSDCSGALELMSQQGAVDTILHTLQMYPDGKEIHLLSLILLGCLIPKKKRSAATVTILASILVKALLRFKEVLDMQILGFRAAFTLLEMSPSAAEELEKESFDKVIFQHMNTCLLEQRNDVLQKLCCMCLSKMAADSDIKHRMLYKACIENDVVMAECLILLGADINKKTKKDSLIYQVCEKGSNPELVELLLNNGTHEQDIRKALSISVKKRDSLIISLLLRKLGLDQANNAICLGGFRLGQIEPCWLSPLFSERRTSNFRRPTSKGVSVARMIIRYRMRKINSESQKSNSDELDETDDYCVLSEPPEDGNVFRSEDIESEGSDGILHVMKKSQSDTAAELCRDLSALQQLRRRHPSSEGGSGDSGPNEMHKIRFFKAAASRRISTESPSLLSMDRECIKLVDLSGNELENLHAICGKSLISSHVEHVVRLELHQNSLSEFPGRLCETMRCLTHLDLHSNRFTSFPSCVLKINSISYLNISRNEIGPSLTLDPDVRCPTLKQFIVSFNHLSSIPDHLGQIVDKLEEISLEGNKITEIVSPLCLSELRLLDISKNDISTIAENFLSQCLKLETFNVSFNKLSSVPYLPSKITTIKLSHNEFTSIPDAILHLPYLRSVDMRNNKITVLPGPSQWESVNLRELIFSGNQISVLNLNGPVYKWARLEKLHLCKNRLKEIPSEIGLLENLTSLDVSKNSELRSFPDEMGKLEQVWDLPLDELQLDLDLKHIGSKTKDIIRFLQQRLKKAVPYYRMKLMIVGNTGSGKTTLLQQLMKLKRSRSRAEKATVGIDVKDWKIQEKGKNNIVLNVWDFSGREEFYCSHPHFMTPRALYLVVYDLSKGATEVNSIKPWLFNIKARASSSPVILVGTHTDVSEEKHLQACTAKIRNELLNHHGFPVIRDYHLVTATEESDSMGKLRKAIVKEIMNFKIRDQPVMGQLIPDSYLELEKRVLQERKKVSPEFPVIRQQRLLEIVQENQLLLDESELPHAVHFLNESGVLLHFEDSALQLRDLYFVDPQWLCNMMSQILTLKGGGFSKYPKGMVQRSDVEKCLFHSKSFPKNYIPQYFKLLEKFQIALPLGEEQLLIPSSLSDHRPVIELPHCENSEIIVRLYEMPYFPMGFWSRLINRLFEVSTFMLSGRERALRPNRMYWRQGIYLNWSPEAYSLVESAVLDNTPESFLKVTVPCSQKGRVLLGQVVDHIDSLLEEWFPGLLATDVCGDGDTLLKKWVLYSFEDGQECQRILLDELLSQTNEECLLVNPEDPRSTIPISQIAPDLVLTDLPANLIINCDQLEIDSSPEYLLGEGGFGSVYRAIYKNEDVAVKIFNKHASEIHLHRLLRQELSVLSHLHHPSLISLLAAGTQPRMLVMELALKGSLDTLFENKKGNLNRTLKHRIALHVADGLRYLHSSMIIYRDLKPHNVLIFNLKTNSEIIAKIADYGIAQYCCSMGIKTSEGTPGFRAPEVSCGNVIYNQQADIYSFGLLLYDILTCGERILDGMRFPCEFDQLAVQGKLPDPVKHYNCSPWPGVEKLIKDCMRENPEERPTSAQIVDTLNSAELLCLMRKVSLPSSLTAECIAASSLTCSRPGVWIGGGSKQKGQISFVDLATGRDEVQDIDNSQVLCLTLVCLPGEEINRVVAGTASGRLIVMSTEDTTTRHQLQKLTDSITSLFFHSYPKHSRENNFLLAGTADGMLAIFEHSVIKCDEGKPQKMVHIGNINTPLMGLSESAYAQDKNTIWAACGSKVVSFTNEFDIWKTIDTKPNYQVLQRSCSEANIISLAVDKYIYLTKKDSHIVEVWDKKTEKMFELIDCCRLFKDEAKKRNKKLTTEDLRFARVKALLLQQNTTLWIGTCDGLIILLDLSTHQPIQLINSLSDSIISMTTAQIERASPKNVVLVVAKHCRTRHELTGLQHEQESLLYVWNGNISLEVQNLQKHIEMRRETADKMKLCSYD